MIRGSASVSCDCIARSSCHPGHDANRPWAEPHRSTSASAGLSGFCRRVARIRRNSQWLARFNMRQTRSVDGAAAQNPRTLPKTRTSDRATGSLPWTIMRGGTYRPRAVWQVLIPNSRSTST